MRSLYPPNVLQHRYQETKLSIIPTYSRHFAWQAWHLVTSTLITCKVVLRGRRLTDSTWWHTPWFHVARGGHNLTSMTPAVDHDYLPGMITSHRACRKSSQNLRLRPKECRTLLWSAEVWRAHHRFDRGLCHKSSFGKQRRGKNHQSLVELEEGEWDTSWDLVFSTHPWIPQRISVVSISCFFSGLQWQVTI